MHLLKTHQGNNHISDKAHHTSCHRLAGLGHGGMWEQMGQEGHLEASPPRCNHRWLGVAPLEASVKCGPCPQEAGEEQDAAASTLATGSPRPQRRAAEEPSGHQGAERSTGRRGPQRPVRQSASQKTPGHLRAQVAKAGLEERQELASSPVPLQFSFSLRGGKRAGRAGPRRRLSRPQAPKCRSLGHSAGCLGASPHTGKAPCPDTRGAAGVLGSFPHPGGLQGRDLRQSGNMLQTHQPSQSLSYIKYVPSLHHEPETVRAWGPSIWYLDCFQSHHSGRFWLISTGNSCYHRSQILCASCRVSDKAMPLMGTPRHGSGVW